MIGSHIAGEGEPTVADAPLFVRSSSDFRIGLKTRPDFQRVAKGRRCHARSLGLQVHLRPEPGDGAPRFGLTVTKRVGNAVERNRIKRRLRAALRSERIVPQPGHDYVIVARREALGLPFAGLIADLTKALEQARSGRASNRQGRPAGKPSVRP